MSADQHVGYARLPSALAVRVPGKRSFLDSAVHSGFFKRLKSSGLSVSQASLGVALGKNPTSRPGSNQKKFDGAVAHAVADGSDLLRPAQPA
jgi:hypothetical protein